jgi:transcriptional regulator ATRX
MVNCARFEFHLNNILSGLRKHGKLLEEGASGFLQKKLAMDGSEAIAENGEVDWASMKKLFSTSSSEDVASFGSKHWASVYLANTPQEAALMGLKFPGVNEVTFLVCVDNLLPYDISALLLLS